MSTSFTTVKSISEVVFGRLNNLVSFINPSNGDIELFYEDMSVASSPITEYHDGEHAQIF